jgi:gliding motility-associated-like protein
VIPNDDVPPEEPDLDPPGDPDMVDVGNGLILPVLQSPNCSALVNEPCGFSNLSNDLVWTANDVDGDIASYNIYFSPTGEEGTFTIVGNSRQTRFTHTGLSSFKGCYRITSVDRSNNESPQSNTVCFDNCPNYELPNTFTPNGDGINDTFRAFDQPNGRCPRFVESVEMVVFNRWGGSEIFRFNSRDQTEPNFFIDWDGTDSDGNVLTDGTYFYQVTVTFDVFDPTQREQVFRNWVKIIR